MTERPYETTLPDDPTSGTTSASSATTTGAGTTSLGSGAPSGQRSGSAASTVGDEAKSVASDTVESGRKVAETAASGAKDVVSEATTQARQLFEQLRSEVDGQASSQGQRAVAGLRSLAEELRQMAEAPEQRGIAGEAAQQAAEGASSFAEWLDNREPGDILEEVRSLARRRPGAFLLGAAAIGVLGGRMTRGLAGGSSGQRPPRASAATTGADAVAYDAAGTSSTAVHPASTGTQRLPSDRSGERPQSYNVGVRDTDTHSLSTTDALPTDETEVVRVEGQSEARG